MRRTRVAKREQVERDIDELLRGDQHPFSTDPNANARDDVQGDEADEAVSLTAIEANQRVELTRFGRHLYTWGKSP